MFVLAWSAARTTYTDTEERGCPGKSVTTLYKEVNISNFENPMHYAYAKPLRVMFQLMINNYLVILTISINTKLIKNTGYKPYLRVYVLGKLSRFNAFCVVMPVFAISNNSYKGSNSGEKV